MFAPALIAAHEARLVARLGDQLPSGRLLRRSVDECWAYRDQLADAVDAKRRPTRALTHAESAFILHEQCLAMLDARYWLERWAVIVKDTGDAEPITPLWVSQDLVLKHLAVLETARADTGDPDGLLVNILKARQLGISTVIAALLSQRTTTSRTVRALIAADVEDQSKYLFSIAETVLDHLPWWLSPERIPPTIQNIIRSFKNGSRLSAEWGKSARGGLQAREKTKGNLGRGRTYQAAHLSELSTWERPEQIDDGLIPAFPRRSRTLVFFESTAKGRYDWWHQHWDQAARGVGRFHNIFIPWYAEPDKYWAPPPVTWAPVPTTIAHAAEVERDSPQWMFGQTIRLSKEQLFWYESERRRYDDEDRGAEFSADGRRLPTFYEEFPSSPREAFQAAGASIFGPKVLERLKTQECLPLAVCAIEPAQDIAQLRAWERAEAARIASTAAAAQAAALEPVRS